MNFSERTRSRSRHRRSPQPSSTASGVDCVHRGTLREFRGRGDQHGVAVRSGHLLVGEVPFTSGRGGAHAHRLTCSARDVTVLRTDILLTKRQSRIRRNSGGIAFAWDQVVRSRVARPTRWRSRRRRSPVGDVSGTEPFPLELSGRVLEVDSQRLRRELLRHRRRLRRRPPPGMTAFPPPHTPTNKEPDRCSASSCPAQT